VVHDRHFAQLRDRAQDPTGSSDPRWQGGLGTIPHDVVHHRHPLVDPVGARLRPTRRRTNQETEFLPEDVLPFQGRRPRLEGVAGEAHQAVREGVETDGHAVAEDGGTRDQVPSQVFGVFEEYEGGACSEGVAFCALAA